MNQKINKILITAACAIFISGIANAKPINGAQTSIIECEIGSAYSLFEIDNINKSVKSAQSDVIFKVIFFKKGLLKFSSDNPFYANDFAQENEFPKEVIITINRVTGDASSQVFFKISTIDDLTNPKYIRQGNCRLVNRKF